MVAMWRAIADGRPVVAQFSDPTAYALLPAYARARVDAVRKAGHRHGRRGGLSGAVLPRRVLVMVARTVAIDDAVRGARSPQVVILGAGLDGRAWRMPELGDAVVFEVDHPDTQREKRARVGSLTQCAREVRFVPVDFTKDRLDDALAAAGHDPTVPTTWVWEGVVMYLSPADVQRTLSVVSARSPAGSRLIVLYFSPSWRLHLLGFVVRRIGEPLRSKFTPDKMVGLLAAHRFEVTEDRAVSEIGRSLSPELERATRPFKHARVVVADKRGGTRTVVGLRVRAASGCASRPSQRIV
jgi:methyltransferase (TIGR00027 family)